MVLKKFSAMPLGFSVLAALSVACNSPIRGKMPSNSESQEVKIMNFPIEIERILERQKDLTAVGSLLQDPSFQLIFNNPKDYMGEAIRFIGIPENSPAKKWIAALAMQNLDLEHFVSFADALLRHLNEGRIDSVLFRKSVLYTYDWNTKLQENFANPEVRGLIDRIIGAPKVDDATKSYLLQEVFTGKAAADILDLRSAGQL